ncbi:MAG: sulfite exporter TauE/SafE family protein [Acidobacteriota bacterium]
MSDGPSIQVTPVAGGRFVAPSRGKLPDMDGVLQGIHGPWAYVILAMLGVVTGTLNVIAGGGSFLTLPMLIFLGLPAGVANGTNRVGILLQNVTAVWSFKRHDVLEGRALLWAALPSTAGAALGAWLALQISDDGFKRLLAFLMIAITLISFWRPRASSSEEARTALLAAGFFFVGIYGGFVQAGVGFLILAVTTFGGLDLVRGNAVKVLAVLCFTGLSLAIFALDGKVSWPHGLALAAGTMVGGALGARLTIDRGHRWIRLVVTAAVLVFAVKLWFS